MLVAAAPSHADLYTWTDWTSRTLGVPGSASGTLTLGSETVNVSYTGDVTNTTQVSGGGINYWNPATPYISSEVDNAPGTTDIIALTGGYGLTYTLTFSTALWNPVMAIVSQGQPGYPVHYSFDQAFTVLSSGAGYWGTGPFYNSTGNVLSSQEGHGVIQFQGAVSSISWTVQPYEYWHGFTIGATQTAVPEPGSAALMLVGLSALSWLRTRRK